MRKTCILATIIAASLSHISAVVSASEFGVKYTCYSMNNAVLLDANGKLDRTYYNESRQYIIEKTQAVGYLVAGGRFYLQNGEDNQDYLLFSDPKQGQMFKLNKQTLRFSAADINAYPMEYNKDMYIDAGRCKHGS